MADRREDDGGKAQGPNAQAINIAFSRLNFSVKDQRTGETIKILKGVSGQCLSGRITAIMGSSGAGAQRPPAAGFTCRSTCWLFAVVESARWPLVLQARPPW